MKSVKVLPATHLSLMLKIENSLELLTKTSEELLQELEKAESPHLKLTLRRRPKWFYREQTSPQPVHIQSSISKVEEQVRCELDGLELDVAYEILANLDHRGFFRGSVEEIARHYGVEEVFVEEVRDFIRREIEPLGVACKSLEEFILLQVEEFYPDEKELAQQVLAVLKGESRELQARRVLSELKLSPFEEEGAPAAGGSVDVVFEYDGAEWYVFLMEDFWEVEAVGAGRPVAFLLELRRRLMRTVAELILERQKGFLLGQEALKSLTLSHVASRAGVSVSTVSRVVSRKHAKTPRGVYPLRSFFVRESKEGLSTEEVLRNLKELLEKEGRGKSDRELSHMLSQRGIKVSRRTVTKYRRILEGKA